MAAMSPAERADIVPLWPTWIGQLALPGAEQRNPELLAATEGPGIAGNLFGTNLPAAGWLRDWLVTCVGQWFEHARVAPTPRTRLTGHLEAIGFGQYRELANEPGAYLAGYYFANAPAAPELDHLRSDCRASHLSLYDPRVGFNALALQGDPNFDESRTLVPVAGTLLLWPGYLRYCSRVHLSHAPWVRVALRVELESRR